MIDLEYDALIAEQKNGRPSGIASLRPIQLSSKKSLGVLAAGRARFSTSEWKAQPVPPPFSESIKQGEQNLLSRAHELVGGHPCGPGARALSIRAPGAHLAGGLHAHGPRDLTLATLRVVA